VELGETLRGISIMSLAGLIQFSKGYWQLLLILGFAALLFGMNQRINALNTGIGQYQKDNEELSRALNGRDDTINALKGAADADRRATEQQLKIEQQKRAKADDENRTLRKALEDNDCGHQRLPADALNILRGATKTSATGPATDLRIPASGFATAV
jgi:predicted RNase H-like nuclease (RuvC/YqgF family)